MAHVHVHVYLVGGSRASDNGPSKKRTTSLQQTSAVLPIEFSIVTLRACARGKVIGRVIVVVVVSTKLKSSYFEIQASKRLLSTTNQSNSAKN